MRILVVEDDRKVASFIRKGLMEEGYAVDVAPDGETGLAMGLDRPHDVIVLDVMLPGKSGVQVVRELRHAKVAAPVLLLTARDAVEDKVQGLDTGADDYLTKPFAFAELLARVRALLRRGTAARTPALQFADLVLDPGTNVIDVYVNYLRKKIDSGRDRKLLHTVRGVGYVLKAD